MIGYKSTAAYSQDIPPGFDLLYPTIVLQIEANGYRGDFIGAFYNPAAEVMAANMKKMADLDSLKMITLPVPLAQMSLMTDLLRSDHRVFWAAGYPAIMISDTGDFRNPSYHCTIGEDTLDSIDFDFARKTVRAVTESARIALNPAM